ncbi:hypothetical protein [Fulvivirga sedimenti]|jgi:hypothetical protein|uniref:DUF4136 domain-containing protein n=1 Tax=Fulvivirga sedimenti TaxID=2879465 RepID=A0A9X1KUG0_9BACT|nr:hypothetical protein [Fulvivirga sedimenti]MCA6073458.1 hypothetical protein [Fulvivirga sedimenti]
MKNFAYLLLLILFGTSCASSLKIDASMKMNDEPADRYSKLAVLVMSPRESVRANLEEAIATEFRTRGIKAVSTFTMFPLANRMNEIELDITPEERAAAIREKIQSREIDGLMIIALLNSEQETRYVQGPSLSVGAPTVIYDSPIYNQPYSGYYTYALATVYGKGYYETSSTYFIEANMYNASTENLFYTAQVTLKDPGRMGEESEKFAAMIVDDVLRKQAVAK